MELSTMIDVAKREAITGEGNRDRFGNPVDPSVGYAWGRIITGEVTEAKRQEQAYAIIRDRYARLGDPAIFNLTGLIRGFPLSERDDDALRSYVHYIARAPDRLERLGLDRIGGNPVDHAGFLATRVSAGMLAIMLALLGRGDRVLSLVPGDRSHPSIGRAVEIAGGRFQEVRAIDALDDALGEEPGPKLVVITTISPSKRHLPLEDTKRAIEAAHASGALAVVDDAHMAARLALYSEPPALALGADLAVWSLDKHLPGPRSGFIAGTRDLVARVKARALSLGLEAQLAQRIAGYRALENFDPGPIRAAAALAHRVLDRISPETDGRGYLAGAGVALSGEDFLELAAKRAGLRTPPLTPIEALAFSALSILRSHGAVTIPAVGMPGAACTFRLMMYPDGERLGEEGFVDVWRAALTATSEALHDPARVRRELLGDEN